jgi:Na+-transporting NADH:ubiquinone oxidoreductase subunit A
LTARIVEASPVVHRLKRGLDLPLAGAPVQAVEPAGPTRLVGVLGDDWHGLKPTFQVQPGQRVRRGDLLFEDKTRPGVRHTSPAAGTVKAIHRGERRAFQSMVIECDDVGDDDEAQAPFASWRAATPAQWTAAEVRALLLESGLWTALRTRPFSQVPAADSSPYALYITAIDTRPHAPSVPMALQGREDDFALGVTMLAMLGNGRTRVCTGPDTRLALPALPGVQPEVFDGPHPAGLPGTHIHVLSPVDLERSVWHIGYQDVAAIGRLFASGRLGAAGDLGLGAGRSHGDGRRARPSRPLAPAGGRGGRGRGARAVRLDPPGRREVLGLGRRGRRLERPAAGDEHHHPRRRTARWCPSASFER